MPSHYRHTAPRLKAEILARVSTGEAVRAIAREPGMPCAAAVRNWAKADPGFGAELAAALRRGRWARVYAFDEAKAAAFLARARAGELIRDLVRAPGMPTRATYRHWRATEPAFDAAVAALMQAREAGRRGKLGAEGRARYRAFDPAVADRVIVALHKRSSGGLPADLTLEEVLATDPALPSRPVLTRWRREQPEFDRVLKMIFAAWRAGRWAAEPVPDVLVEEIVEHIMFGGSFASYCRAGGPSRATLRRWNAKDPAFAAQVAQACELREEWLHDQVVDILTSAPPGPLREMKRSVGPLLRHMTRLRHRPGAVHVTRSKAGAAKADGADGASPSPPGDGGGRRPDG